MTIRMSPSAMSGLYGKDIIAYGTGLIGKRLIPYLAQDPTLRLRGVTNSRVTADDEGTFLDTGLPVRSIQAWAKQFPDAAVLITSSVGIEEITAICNAAGIQDIRLITAEMISALVKAEDQIAESKRAEYLGSICMANEIHSTHKAAFSEFKGCNRGKTAVVVATGPSLNYYTQIAGACHIGVNGSFLKSDLKLDFYFLLHNYPAWLEKLKEYSFVKFFGMNTNGNSTDQIPEYVIEENGGRKFFTADSVPGTGIHTNIEYYPLAFYSTVAFPAIHFALYTHPKQLLLVGCDCAINGHFDETLLPSYADSIQVPQWIDGYREMKRFAAIHYPDTEIISVNPVGLRGMFQDVYTKSFLNAFPEINRSECRILDK